MFTYDRSAAGAKEKITIKNCNIEIAVNGEAKTVTELNFILNEYGDCTGDKATQYQCKIPVGKKLSAGDTVTVTFKNKNGDFSGEGESTAKIDTLTVSLIDNAEAANWYKELVADDLEYQPLFNKENSSNNGDPVTPPAGDEGNTGTGNEDGKVALGLDAMDGWGKYEISDKSATGFTMKSTAAQKKDDCCGADITFGSATKVTFTVTNNATEECWVQVLVKKDGDSNSESGSRMTSATIDGVDAGDVTWGANTTINAKTSKNFVLNLTNTDADKFVFALNSNLEDNNKSSGNITVSEAYMYK